MNLINRPASPKPIGEGRFIEFAKIILLVSISSLLIFWQFNRIPKNLSFDEVEFAKLALSLENKPYTAYSPLATGHSTLYFYIILLSFKFFGISKFSLRLPSAIFGILSVVVFYLILKIISSKTKILNTKYLPRRQAGLILYTLIFLTSRWFINFSRFSFEATFLLFFELGAIYFLLQCFKTSKWSYANLVGLFSGLAFNSYTPGRIFFLLPLGFIVFKTVRQFNHMTIKPLLYFLIPFLIAITPLSLYLADNKDLRFEDQFFLSNEQLTPTKKAGFLFQNVKALGLMFNIKGDMNGRHNYPGKPALNPILGGLFIIGFMFSLKNFKKKYNLLFIIYFFISLFPSLLTYPWENPSMLRTYTTLPSIAYFISIAIYNLSAAVIKWLPNKKTSVVAGFLFIVFASSFYELRTYFKYQSRVFNNAFEIKCGLKDALKSDPDLIFKNCGAKKNEF